MSLGVTQTGSYDYALEAVSDSVNAAAGSFPSQLQTNRRPHHVNNWLLWLHSLSPKKILVSLPNFVIFAVGAKLCLSNRRRTACRSRRLSLEPGGRRALASSLNPF